MEGIFFIGEYPTHPAQILYIASMSLVTGTEQYEIWFMSLVWRPRIFKWLLDFWEILRPNHDYVRIPYGKVCHKQRVDTTEVSGGV
jgi:hypothetical protein